MEGPEEPGCSMDSVDERTGSAENELPSSGPLQETPGPNIFRVSWLPDDHVSELVDILQGKGMQK